MAVHPRVAMNERWSPVVGLSFQPTYPDNILRLNQALAEYTPVEGARGQDESFAVVLLANPQNPHDANAVEVHIPSMGQMVGHLPRDVAAVVSPVLLSGEPVLAWVAQVRINPEHPNQPGLDVAFRRVKDTQ